MKTFLLLATIGFIYTNCKTSRLTRLQKNVSGTYEQKDDRSIELTLHDDSTFLYFTPPGRHSAGCCDTISYGKWSVEPNDMITLSSPEYLSKNLKAIVEESRNLYQDTIYITINNPIEKYLSGKDVIPRFIQYAVGALAVTEDAFLEQVNDLRPSNMIKLYNPKRLGIASIHVVVFVKPDYTNVFASFELNEGIRNAMTNIYITKDKKANQFNINIPDLTNEFLKYRRLNRDFVKVINGDQLEWDGHIYVKRR